MIHPPMVEDVSWVLGKASWAAPGPDGLRYDAWNTGPGPRILLAVLRWISQGHLMDSAFSAVLAVILPEPLKGAPDGPGEGGVFRKASETRPLGLTNTSNKVACGVLNKCLNRVARAIGAKSQNGFIRNRNFLSNLTDLGLYARAASALAQQY
eukprot:5971685-Pyramimonas_sp.AAC.1